MQKSSKTSILSQQSRKESYSTSASLSSIMSCEKHQQLKLQIIDEIESERTSFKSEVESDEDFQQGKLLGQYVITIRDACNLQKLSQQDNNFMQSLIMNHIPIVYNEDLSMHLNETHIPIILDYFNFNNTTLPFNTEEIASFCIFCKKKITLKKQLSNNSNRSSESRSRMRIRTKSTDLIKFKQKIDRLLIIHNIDQQLSEQQQEDSPTQDISLLKKNSYSDDKLIQEQVIYKQCCLNNQCKHPSKIEQIRLDTLFYYAFTSENKYYLCVLMLCYELLQKNHIDFIKETFSLYFNLKSNYYQKINVIQGISLWLDYRFVDLIEDNSNICTLLIYLTNFAILLNYRKFQELDIHLLGLLKQVKLMKNHKLNQVQIQLGNKNKNRRSSDQLGRRKHRQQLSFNQINFNELQIKEEKQQFTDWQFYLDIPVIILQRQLWIIDVELFSKISISQLLKCDERNPMKNNHMEIADQFDYLLFHMICSTIYCPPQFLNILLTKFIELYALSVEAQHFQLTHILFCFFQHHIIQQILNVDQHLNRLNQLRLQELLSTEIYKTLNPININTQNGIVPCLSQIQLSVYRIKQNKIYTENQFLNFCNLELLANQLFSITQLQVLERQCIMKYNQYKLDPYYTYLKIDLKNQIMKQFNHCGKNLVEIQLFKLSRKLIQNELFS